MSRKDAYVIPNNQVRIFQREFPIMIIEAVIGGYLGFRIYEKVEKNKLGKAQ